MTPEKIAEIKARMALKQQKKDEKKAKEQAIKDEKKKQKDLKKTRVYRNKRNKKIREAELKRKRKKGISTERKNITSWRIMIVSQNKKMTEICYASEKEDALFKFNKIIEENKKDVRFPIKVSSRDHIQIKAKYELLLLELNKKFVDNESMLRNEIGQFAPNKANSEKWIINQKADFLMEESFWVYGFNPSSQRKSFNWILNDFLIKGIEKIKYPMKRITVYKNKMVIDSDEDFDIVICKCQEDAIRLYNELEKEIIKAKIKSVFFSGFCRDTNREKLIEKIALKTGWARTKIVRPSTRP